MSSQEEALLPSFSENILRKLDTMRKNCILTDVILVCGEKKFHAHRSILSAASEYLYVMFNSGLKESVEHTVEFPTIDSETMEIVLEILYTGKLVSVDFSKLKDILVLAHLMQLHDIFYHYRFILLSNISCENFLMVWDLGEDLQDEELLTAVYDMAENIYLSPDFQKVDTGCLRKLILYLTWKEVSLELPLKLIIKWVTTFNQENCMEIFEELIDMIDFERVPNNALSNAIESPLVMMSGLFKEKYIDVTSKRIRFIDEFLKNTNTLATIFLFGQDADLKCTIQKFHAGEWTNNIYLEQTESDNAYMMMSYRSEFTIVNKKPADNDFEAYITVFNRNGDKQMCKKLGYVPSDAKLTATEFKDLFIITAYGDYFTENFYFSEDKVENCHTSSDLRIIKVQWLQCSDSLFVVTQKVSIDGCTAFSFWKFIVVGNKYKLCKLETINFPQENSNWFAYFLPPHHLVLRFFPGFIILYDIQQKYIRQKKENKTIDDVVALDIYCDKVWCLRQDGCLLIQDTTDVESDWKVVIKSPFPLRKYFQLVIENSIIHSEYSGINIT